MTIQGGKLLIVAKLGDLLPDGRGDFGRGRPKQEDAIESVPTALSKHTASTYRKVATNAPKIEEYVKP